MTLTCKQQLCRIKSIRVSFQIRVQGDLSILIECKATVRIDAPGLHLKGHLCCAHDLEPNAISFMSMLGFSAELSPMFQRKMMCVDLIINGDSFGGFHGEGVEGRART